MSGAPDDHDDTARSVVRKHEADAEVIVVGAGPAGSTVALLLARAGFDVLILERREFPRAKPCGDCLSAGALPLLRRLGLLDLVLALPHAPLRGWRIVAPRGTAFTAYFQQHGSSAECALAVERVAFDAALLAAARDAGARVIHGVRIDDLRRTDDGRVCGVASGSGHWHAPLVIAADGLRSILAARLGAVRRPPRLRKLSLTAHVDRQLTAESDIGEMHCGDGLTVGLAPVDVVTGRCNLTVVADAGRYGRMVAADPHAFVTFALTQMPLLTPLHALDADGLTLLGSGPFDRPVRRVVFDGAALAGDAAGYYDPFTGQGVFQALAGAVLLADAATAALRGRDCSARSLAPYAVALGRLRRGARIVQHGIEAALARPAIADRAIAAIARAPRFASALIAVTGDTLPPRTLLSPHVLSSLIARA